MAIEAKSTVIVVGAHKPDLSEYLLGPNAARIVRHSKCSVYVVRQTG
jgi:nucleotide-binding universal stress UspA family protein